MPFDAPSPPPPDPTVVAQQEAAQAQRGEQIQQGVSAQTLDMLRMFGGGGLLTGAKISLGSPMSGLGTAKMPSLFGTVA